MHTKQIITTIILLTLFLNITLIQATIPQKNPQNLLSEYTKSLKTNSHIEPFPYEPYNITPKDAAYHPSTQKFTIEWWYFEGIFTNGYNAIVNVILLSKNNFGIFFTHLNIFHTNHTEQTFAKRIIHPMKHFNAQQTHPEIKIKNTPIIQFNTTAYNTTNTWIYTLTYNLNNHAVNLTFIGETPGWEGNTLNGKYGPVLPIAQVHGTIHINNKTINVTGLGYHEHAHGIAFPIKEWGWYWGKIVGTNSSLFWGKMMNTRWHEQARAGVFSIKNHTYTNINPEHITITLSNYIFQSRRFIPTTLTFTIADAENNIYINVTLTTKTIQYLPLGIFHYWRYLILLNGEIHYQETIEYLHNTPQIMEVMRFR
jgi:hypothetical protein